MNSKAVSRETLKREIVEAFGKVPYPGDDNIANREHIAKSGKTYACEECGELVELLKGQRWQNWTNNPAGLIRPPKDQGVPALLTAEAFQYYFPLIMLASILEYEKANLLPGNLVSAFLPAEANLNEHQADRIGRLTGSQFQAVLACLRFLKQEHGDDLPDIGEAIELIEARLGGRK